MKSINKLVDSETGNLINRKNNGEPDLHNTIEPEENDYKKYMKKLDPNDKKTIKWIEKDSGVKLL